MTTLKERLKELMAEHGLTTQQQLADFAEVSKGLVGQWFNGSTGLGAKPLLAFEKKTNFSPQWLVDGVGEKYRDVPRPRDHYIPPAGGIAVLEDTDTTYTHREIEMYELRLSAGLGNAEWVPRKADDPLVFRNGWFRARGLNPNTLRGMYVKGDSMRPVLNNRDTIIIDISDTELVDGEIYAVVYREKFYIKQIKHLADGIELVSFNTEYKPMPVKNGDADQFQCLGRMVWRGG